MLWGAPMISNASSELALLSRRAYGKSGSFETWVGRRRVVVDDHLRLQAELKVVPSIDVSINKDERARDILFDDTTPSGRFMEIDGGDGRLIYLPGIRGNFEMDEAKYAENKKMFDAMFRYISMDLEANAPSQGAGWRCVS